QGGNREPTDEADDAASGPTRPRRRTRTARADPARAPAPQGADRRRRVRPPGPGRAAQGGLADPRRGRQLLDHRPGGLAGAHRPHLPSRLHLRQSRHLPLPVSDPTTDMSDPTPDILSISLGDPEEAAAEPEPEAEAAIVFDDGLADDDEEEEAPVESPYDRPGSWYVVHTYAGYENKVKSNLQSRIASMNMEDRIFECVIPMEDVI